MRVIHFEIQADDIERATKFYNKTFGWKIEKAMSASQEGEMDYWLIMTGAGPGIDGGIYKRTDIEEKFYTYDCTIDVPDIDTAIEAIKKNGGTVTIEKSEIQNVGLFAGAKDTEGNRFGIMQAIGWKPEKTL